MNFEELNDISKSFENMVIEISSLQSSIETVKNIKYMLSNKTKSPTITVKINEKFVTLDSESFYECLNKSLIKFESIVENGIKKFDLKDIKVSDIDRIILDLSKDNVSYTLNQYSGEFITKEYSFQYDLDFELNDNDKYWLLVYYSSENYGTPFNNKYYIGSIRGVEFTAIILEGEAYQNM